MVRDKRVTWGGSSVKITFEKGIRLHEMLEFLELYLLDEYEGEIVLTKKIEINLLLDEYQGYNDYNERVYSIGKKYCAKMEELKKQDADIKLEEEWEAYTGEWYYNKLLEENTTDQKYLETAVENNRSKKEIERRKGNLLRREKKLKEERERLNYLKRFIDMVKEDKVKYKYIEYKQGRWEKVIIFELEEPYIFYYNPYIDGVGELKKQVIN